MAEVRPSLKPLEEVLARMLEVARARAIRETELVPTLQAWWRILARPVHSTLDVPPADNTSMDGYALRVADVPQAGVCLPVSQRIPAGVVGQPMQPGTAARIFTGAQVPPGADAVVMQEQCDAIAGDGLGQVRVNAAPAPGQWIRRRGEDVMADSQVLAAGDRLTPQALGLAASVGAAELEVCRRPRVALFSTGDELVMPGQPLKPGAIYNSNRYTLHALLQAAGCTVSDLGIVPDSREATRQALREAALGHDLVLTSGGVSVGEEDHLKPAVQAEGWLEAWQVAMKPGKPLAFGAIGRGDGGESLFMGLPGNPVSSFVTFVLTVAPVLRALQGSPVVLPRPIEARAAFAWPRPDRRREFLRVRFDANGGVEIFANQSSGVLTSAVWAEALLDNPAGQAIAPGDMVKLLPLSALMSA